MPRTRYHMLSVLSLLTLAGSALSAPVPLEVSDAAGKKFAGDVMHGEVVFRRCMVCHTTDAGVNRIGPSLHGIIGRMAGSVAGFVYSPANKRSGIVWTEQKIFDYLQNPQAMVPGTKMSFPGLPQAQDRADVIAYLAESTK